MVKNDFYAFFEMIMCIIALICFVSNFYLHFRTLIAIINKFDIKSYVEKKNLYASFTTIVMTFRVIIFMLIFK